MAEQIADQRGTTAIARSGFALPRFELAPLDLSKARIRYAPPPQARRELPPVPSLSPTPRLAARTLSASSAATIAPGSPAPLPVLAPAFPAPHVHRAPIHAPAPTPVQAPQSALVEEHDVVSPALAVPEVALHRTTSKLPHITLSFWLLKMAATTLGETGGDQISEAMHLGFVVTFVIFMVAFLVAVTAQVRAGRLVPALFWTVIVATSAAGTEMADFVFKTVGIGFISGVGMLLAPIAVIFLIARSTGGTFSVTDIQSRRDEALYWTTILTTNTVGTGIGDGLTAGLGALGGTIVACTAMAIIVWMYFRTSISRVALFWAAFIMTRPLGAAGGDLLWQPRPGGFGLGRIAVSVVLLSLMVIGIAITNARQAERT